mgnify:CR=1 FL=1
MTETQELLIPSTHARAHPDRPAIVMASSGETVTYAQLEERSIRFARALRSRGLRPGDRLATLTDNSPGHVAVLFACAKAGIALQPLSGQAQTGLSVAAGVAGVAGQRPTPEGEPVGGAAVDPAAGGQPVRRRRPAPGGPPRPDHRLRAARDRRRDGARHQGDHRRAPGLKEAAWTSRRRTWPLTRRLRHWCSVQSRDLKMPLLSYEGW